MKKIFLIVAVLMLATSAWATNVEIKAVGGDEPNEVDIWYETDGNLPRAFGLNITVTDGSIVDINDFFEVGECDDVNRGFGIFPANISISGNEITSVGTPVAPNDAPGAIDTGLDTNTIVVEMGSLYTGANTPDPCALLCTIIVNMDCDVSIAENETRGGLVMENPDEVVIPTLTPYTVTGVSRWVPDVVGWEQSAAETEIVDVCDLVVGDISWVCHSSIDYDHVVSTDPEAGTEVEKGSSVDLLKSLGRPHVPDVVNEPNLAAQETIEDVCGLSVGNVTAECNDIIPAGNVISTNPAYCNYPDCDTTVDIVVSTGPCVVACECYGDVTGDSMVRIDDVVKIVGWLNAYGVEISRKLTIPSTDTEHYDLCADVTGDGMIRIDDCVKIVGWLNAYGVEISRKLTIECPHPYGP